MPVPQYPQDFKVLYAEGASYWWWSPFTDETFDGTVPVGQSFPFGILVGCEEHASHELEAGEPVVVVWTNHDTAGEVMRTAVYDPLHPEVVQRLVTEVADEVAPLVAEALEIAEYAVAAHR